MESGMARQDCLAFVERIRRDAQLARAVAECGQDRTAVLAIARANGYAVESGDLEAYAAAYAKRPRS